MGINGLLASLVILNLFIYTASSSANIQQITSTPQEPPAGLLAEACQAKLKPPRFTDFGPEQNIVLDTNILVNDPDSFQHFGKAHVVIPITVLNELNKFKTEENGSRGRGARQFYRDFYKIMEQHQDKQIYPTRDGGTVSIELGEKTSSELLEKLHEDTNDARIIQSAFKLLSEDKPVLFVTQDVDALARAKAVGIKTTKYINPYSKLDENTSYTGVSLIDLTPEKIKEFETNGEIDLPLDTKLNENQAVIMKLDGTVIDDVESVPTKQVGRVRIVRDENDQVVSMKLKKLVDLDEINFPIRPRNLEQYIFIDLLCDDSIPLKTALGQAGSGKTFVMVAWAVWKVLTQTTDTEPMQIFITRPSVEMGQKLGFLPGSKDDKMAPYLDPFKDAFESLARVMNERNWHPLNNLRYKQATEPVVNVEIDPVKLFPEGFFNRNENDRKQWLKAQRAHHGNDLFNVYNRIVGQERHNRTRGLNRQQRRLQDKRDLDNGGRDERKSPVFTESSGRKPYWTVDKIMKDARIQTMALQYIRGRSLSHTIVLADEMQNDTPHVAKSLGTRVAEGSYVVMAGDINQIDSPFLDKHNNGLSIMIDRMMGSPAAGHITLLKNERSFLSKEITKRFGDMEE